MTIYEFLQAAPHIPYVGSLTRGYQGEELSFMRPELEQVDIFEGKEIIILNAPMSEVVENKYVVNTYVSGDFYHFESGSGTFMDKIFIYSITLDSNNIVRWRVTPNSVNTISSIIDRKIEKILNV